MSGASTAQQTTASSRADEAAAIAGFTRGFSVEATRPLADDVAALAAIVAPGTHVYISAVAHRPLAEIVEAATRLRQAGLEPVPHLAVRNFADVQELESFLARLGGEADVHRLLVIAGDRDQPAGDFRRAVEVIDGGILQRHGIRDIGIAGYPDGHPRIPQHDLDVALADKTTVAEAVGIGVHIVTQFCFEPQAILAWVRRLRSFGMEHPVRIGLAGPTSLSTLLRFAQRCGVRASAQALARQTGLLRQLFAMSAPDPLVRALAAARGGGRTGEIAPQFFSFGGLARSARWAQAVADGRIELQPGEGFRVDPPPG
jgi:methylenetetrahydrofolate reductase (NADPH)